jgi:hypothetical protein
MLYKAGAPCSWYKPQDQTEGVEPRLRAGGRAVVNEAVVGATACVVGQGGETADARALEGLLVQGVRKSQKSTPVAHSGASVSGGTATAP